FSVVAQGTAPLAYQWRHNGNNIPGATASTYNISQIRAGDFGRYSVLVYNSSGAISSVDVVLSAVSSSTVLFLNDRGSLPSPPDRLIRFLSASTPGNVFAT